MCCLIHLLFFHLRGFTHLHFIPLFIVELIERLQRLDSLRVQCLQLLHSYVFFFVPFYDVAFEDEASFRNMLNNAKD
jgi:hypothetical protein